MLVYRRVQKTQPFVDPEDVKTSDQRKLCENITHKSHGLLVNFLVILLELKKLAGKR